MYELGWLDIIPLWLMLVATVVATCASVEAGYRLGRRQRLSANAEAEAPVGAIVGATLGLLAFILAFTFSLAASRFDDRRHVVLDEANAIRATYLQAGMLAEPFRSELRRLLREYVNGRIRGINEGKIDEVLKAAGDYHARMWIQAEAAVKEDRSDIAAQFVNSLNDVIQLHAWRVQAGMRSRIPPMIWIALLFVTLVSMTATGYQLGLTSKKRTLVSFALVLTFGAVVFLIADLDRPGAGVLEVSQQATLDVLESMSRMD